MTFSFAEHGWLTMWRPIRESNSIKSCTTGRNLQCPTSESWRWGAAHSSTSWTKSTECLAYTSVPKPGKRYGGYFVTNSNGVFDYKIHRWLLSIIDTGFKVNRCTHLYDRFLTDEFPSENGRLKPIIEAMETDKKINIIYKPYNKETSTTKISPYCIKTYKHRFYVLGRLDSGHFRIYSFDRMKDVE